MLKTAYQIGVMKALEEAGLTKEAQGFLRSLGEAGSKLLGRAGRAGAQHSWKTLGMGGAAPWQQLTGTAQQLWRSLTPAQRQALQLAGVGTGAGSVLL